MLTGNTNTNTQSNNQLQNQIVVVDNDSINQDLQRLKQMNEAFSKMNYHHIQNNNQYYSYYLNEISSLSICQGQQQQHGQQESIIYYKENGQYTERSNSLLFALSEKDDYDDTRPTANLNHLNIDSNKFNHLQTLNQNNFEQSQYYQNQSLPINNTIHEHKLLPKNVFTDLNCPKIHQSRYYQSRFQTQKKEENQIQGFSKYTEFAIKISKLFNVQVEDLQIIYNQLQAEKQNQMLEVGSQRLTLKSQVTDSEVMKKLFDYALKIKNSHNRLMDIITTIDSKRPKTTSNTVTQTQLENVSLNFLLEQELSRSQLNNNHQQINQPIKLSKNPLLFGQPDLFSHEQNSTLQSKNTIVRKLQSPQSPTFEINSGQTIQSFTSMVYSQKTQTKSYKSIMKNKVTEKIKLISEQLQSLKLQINKDDQCEDEHNAVQQKQYCQPYQLHVFSEIKEKENSNQQNRQRVRPFYLEKPISSIQKDESTEQKKPQTNLTQTRQYQSYPFARQNFTYLKSANEITKEDPQINRKIQQTIKTCIVKSSSKKSQPSQLKQNQKIIVEPVSVQTSKQKYSFKSQSFQPSQSPNIDTKSQNRQKMFRSIVQIRKSFSKDKKTFKNSPIKTQIKKTSNIAYLEDEEKDKKQQNSAKQNLNGQKRFAKKSAIADEKFLQKSNIIADNSLLHEENTHIATKKTINNVYEIGIVPIQQSSVISQETPQFLSSQNIQFINENNQNVIIQQHELPTQRINYPRNYSQVQLKREPSQEKIRIIQPVRYLQSAKTVQSRPMIEIERLIPKVIYHPNLISNPTPRPITTGDQKLISITISPRTTASFQPHYFQTNKNPSQAFRNSSIQKISISRPVTPIQIVKNQNFIPQHFTQRSMSTQKLQLNGNMPRGYAYIPRANNFFSTKRNNQQFTTTNQSISKYSFNNQPIQVRAITQRQSSTTGAERRHSIPIRTLTPQKRYLQPFQQHIIEQQPINLQFKKCSNMTTTQNEIKNLGESIKQSITKKTQVVEPKLEQSFMYYGPINPVLQKTLPQSNLLTSKKDQSVVRAFQIQPYQSQKMSNSVYAKQEIPQKKSANFPQTPRIPKNLKPPKYIPPKQLTLHQQKFFDNQTNRYNKNLQESKPFESQKETPIMDESKKSHIAINSSSVKSPQYDLEDSPSFGVFNEQSYANTFYISPARPSAVDSRDSSESKRSAISSRSKSSKKGIALESKRRKSPSHIFVQSCYIP